MLPEILPRKSLNSTATKWLLLCLFSAAPFLSGAQEFNCQVTINADQVQTSDRAIFTEMETTFAQFINNRKWTQDTYKNHEKIKCSFFITLTMPSYGVFTGNAQITASRPIFQSNYESALFNFADRNWNFEYQESQPLEFNDNAYLSNLTSMLAFYAYLILAMDYDSFGELSGSEYVQKAMQVLNNAQNSGKTGWTMGSPRNRYALMEGFNNSQLINWRKATYQYHRNGLDVMATTPNDTRDVALTVVKNMKELWEINPTSVMLVLFFDTKATELANVFSSGQLAVRREAYDILSNIDSKRTVYEKIMEN